MRKWKTPWGVVSSAVCQGTGFGEEWWTHDIIPYLCMLAPEAAERLYQDLCRVQIAVFEGKVPARLVYLTEVDIDWQDISHVKRFWALCMANGRLADLVADCIELKTPKERKQRWETRSLSFDELARTHRRDSDYFEKLSTFRMQSREAARLAYEKVHCECRGEVHEETTWRYVIVSTPERLSRQSRFFWRGLVFSGCTLEEKQAILHKLEICQIYSACPEEIAKRREALVQDLFLASEHASMRTSMRYGYRKWLRMILKAMLLPFQKRGAADDEMTV